MLKHRLIMGVLISALLLALFWLDSYAKGGWPYAAWSTPPGTIIAILSLMVVPLALVEMRNLLARENVAISLRVTILASTLCMLWPWIEQVSESIEQQHAQLVAGMPASGPSTMGLSPGQQLTRIESSPWYTLGRTFRSVKPHYLVPTVLVFSLVAAVVKHSRARRVEGAMANAGGTLLAITYLGVLPGFFLPICMSHSAWMVLGVVGIVKAADIGAYATGHMIGRHKLIPWLSPGKTVEGFFGGLAFAGIVGAGVAALLKSNAGAGDNLKALMTLSLPLVLAGGALSGILLGAVGQLGDLLESLLKRDAGVKDSGVVPGFGGVLDLLDSPLLAAPVAYWLLKIVLRT